MRCFGTGEGRLARLYRASNVRVHVALIGVMCAFAIPVAEIRADDCGQCHAFQVKMVAIGGGKHATEVRCADCHSPHQEPAETEVASCVHCHEGRPHYEINNCRQCHVDAHMPLSHLQDPVKPAKKECLSCHDDIGQEMMAEPSRHAELFCNRCHRQHKRLPACLDCHPPHLAKQSISDCRICHPAHQPRHVVIGRYVPAAFCATCHDQEARDLVVNNTHHGLVNCTYCHRGRHTKTPECHDCHGLPHVTPLHRKHPRCSTCHGSAHRLVSGR